MPVTGFGLWFPRALTFTLAYCAVQAPGRRLPAAAGSASRSSAVSQAVAHLSAEADPGRHRVAAMRDAIAEVILSCRPTSSSAIEATKWRSTPELRRNEHIDSQCRSMFVKSIFVNLFIGAVYLPRLSMKASNLEHRRQKLTGSRTGIQRLRKLIYSDLRQR